MRTLRNLAWLSLVMVLTTACATRDPLQPITRKVDLPRFMGPWYVISSIPVFLERGAHNGVESYRLNDQGEIETTYTFRQDSFDGKVKSFHPKGFVHNRDTNAEWRMQFIWPFKSAYLIVYLDDDYQRTIIGVPDRSYVWIMSRTPEIPAAEYARLTEFLQGAGYDVGKLEPVPQRWPDPAIQVETVPASSR
jgi:apolipoprotein D and lipocalin family protein